MDKKRFLEIGGELRDFIRVVRRSDRMGTLFFLLSASSGMIGMLTTLLSEPTDMTRFAFVTLMLLIAILSFAGLFRARRQIKSYRSPGALLHIKGELLHELGKIRWRIDKINEDAEQEDKDVAVADFAWSHRTQPSALPANGRTIERIISIAENTPFVLLGPEEIADQSVTLLNAAFDLFETKKLERRLRIEEPVSMRIVTDQEARIDDSLTLLERQIEEVLLSDKAKKQAQQHKNKGHIS